MALKTVIFVDGQNFRHNLRDFHFRSDPPHPNNPEYRLDEKHFRWQEFFQDALAKFDYVTGWEHQLVRVYWYYAENITPWSPNLWRAQRIVDDYSIRIPELTTDLVIQKAQDWYEHEFRRFHQLRKSVFEEIQQNTNFLEFRYVGQYVVQPFRPYRLEYDYDGNINFQGTQVGEKGVDIGIAVDMISKMESFDAAVLVSGDGDFFPVVKFLKDNLKYVYHFSVGRGVGHDTQYFSSTLRGVVDCFQGFDELELLTNYVNEHAGIPPAIMDTINLRAAELERILDDEGLDYDQPSARDAAAIQRR